MLTAFQANAFQTQELAFQIVTEFDTPTDWRPFRRERRKIFTGALPLHIRMR